MYSVMQTGQESSGMQTMNQSLAQLYQAGFIDWETAEARSPDRGELQNMIKKFEADAARGSRSS